MAWNLVSFDLAGLGVLEPPLDTLEHDPAIALIERRLSFEVVACESDSEVETIHGRHLIVRVEVGLIGRLENVYFLAMQKRIGLLNGEGEENPSHEESAEGTHA